LFSTLIEPMPCRRGLSPWVQRIPRTGELAPTSCNDCHEQAAARDYVLTPLAR
jgi:hypothetical protein